MGTGPNIREHVIPLAAHFGCEQLARRASAYPQSNVPAKATPILRVPVGTLYQWRHRRTGPRAFKVGRHLRYNPADVRAWLEDQAA